MKNDAVADVRLFFGNPLPEEWPGLLQEFTSLNTVPGKWVPQENLHITNLFIGSYPEALLPDLISATEKSLQVLAPIKLKFKAFRYAPDKNRARMVWAQFEENEEFTAMALSLWQVVDKMAKRHGLKIKRSLHNKVLPHVTLTRFAPHKEAALPPLVIPEKLLDTLQVARVNLYKSLLSPKGAKYGVVQSYNLSY